MPKKPGLSHDAHVALGEQLATMRDQLAEVTVQLSKAYPLTVSELANRALKGVDDLRSRLDDLAAQEFPDLSTTGNRSVYYPERDRSQSP